MKFTELDQQMRVYETAHDYCVPMGNFMVVRLDGRSFTRLTKEVQQYRVPFDEAFRDSMIATTSFLMQESGFQIRFGYTESDEISLLLESTDQSFGRKLRKINSILAGEASSHLSLALQQRACFDSRVSCLPNQRLVVDYFRWRQSDAERNSLNSWCYWILRRDGKTPTAATALLSGRTVAEKNELLFRHNINFNDVPAWQKRGCGLRWANQFIEAVNPKTNDVVSVQRRRLDVDQTLPAREQYSEYVQNILEGVD